MKNIILQHWTGEMNELGELSAKNIEKYAHKLGAEYRLLRGNIFRPERTPQTQKLYMLNKEFDPYDIVVMMDMDMFTRKGMEENIFEDIKGVGMFTEFQVDIRKRRHEKLPKLTNLKYAFWGGAVYRLERDIRQRLRVHINEDEMVQINNTRGNDEAIMHRLATLAKITDQALPGDYKWCHCSYRKGIENAALIHIRTKITPSGPKKTKIENYRTLVEKGLIEE